MRRSMPLPMLVAVAALVLIPASLAQAEVGPPQHVTFSVVLRFVDPPDHPPCTPQNTCHAVGTFSEATPPLCPAGLADDRYVFPGLQRDRTYACADGSGTFSVGVKYKKFFEGPTPGTLAITGTWEIVKGTGAYRGLQGHGSLLAIFDPSPEGGLSETNEGEVVIAA
jgi:hypothetical protein